MTSCCEATVILTTKCTGGSPFRRLSGASKGDTNGFFMIGLEGIRISAGHPERSGSNPSGNSVGLFLSGVALRESHDDLAASEDVGSNSDWSQLEASCLMFSSSCAVSRPSAVKVSSCCKGCKEPLSKPNRKR